MIVVRHGRTVANAAGLLQGRIDHPLDDVGRSQARMIADALGSVDRVIASPLLRAQETAAALGVPVEIDDRWLELDYGELDGKAVHEVPDETWRALAHRPRLRSRRWRVVRAAPRAAWCRRARSCSRTPDIARSWS